MTQLELQQRGLLDLIKGRGVSREDPYLQKVAGSRQLAMMREIALWWRAFQLSGQCRFTSRLLKRLGCFDATVAAYFNNNATSPFMEELGRDFLVSLCEYPDPLVQAVAQFEYGFLEARAGSQQMFEVFWDRNPDQVFCALEDGSELPCPEPRFLYRMQIARALPHMFACVREEVLS
jgi:hypothetical protein